MIPPRILDINEWYILISALVILSVSVWIPRRLPVTHIITVLMFNFFLAVTADHILAAPPYDLYDIMDVPQFEYWDVFIYLFNYPPAAYLFVQIYETVDKRRFSPAKLIFLWAAGAWGLEWFSNLFNVYTYKGWSIWYSGPVYVAVFTVNYWFHRWLIQLRASSEPEK